MGARPWVIWNHGAVKLEMSTFEISSRALPSREIKGDWSAANALPRKQERHVTAQQRRGPHIAAFQEPKRKRQRTRLYYQGRARSTAGRFQMTQDPGGRASTHRTLLMRAAPFGPRGEKGPDSDGKRMKTAFSQENPEAPRRSTEGIQKALPS